MTFHNQIHKHVSSEIRSFFSKCLVVFLWHCLSNSQAINFKFRSRTDSAAYQLIIRGLVFLFGLLAHSWCIYLHIIKSECSSLHFSTYYILFDRSYEFHFHCFLQSLVEHLSFTSTNNFRLIWTAGHLEGSHTYLQLYKNCFRQHQDIWCKMFFGSSCNIHTYFTLKAEGTEHDEVFSLYLNNPVFLRRHIQTTIYMYAYTACLRTPYECCKMRDQHMLHRKWRFLATY